MRVYGTGRALAAITLGALCSAVGQAGELRIDNVTIVSAERAAPLRNASVHIKDDRIVSVTQSAPAKASSAVQVIDAKGLYLSPGLIDSHVHLGEVPGMLPEHMQAHTDITRTAFEQIPRSYLYFGFTSLFDLISTAERMRPWQQHELRPDTYYCGATPVMDGYPTNWTPKPQRYEQAPYMIVQRGDESSAPPGMDPAKHTPTAVVARMKADGASCVKAFFERGFGPEKNLPTPRPDTMQELLSAARAAGMPIFLHANSLVGQQAGAAAGVDVIAHGLWHWDGEPISSELTPDIRQTLDEIVKRDIGWQATMQVLYGELDLFDPNYLGNPQLMQVVPKSLIDWYRTPQGQTFRNEIASALLPKPTGSERDLVADWSAARSFFAAYLARNRNATAYLAQRNARFLFGSDTPSAPSYANPPGLNGRLEMNRLIDAGLTPAQIFKAATLSNAVVLKLESEIGTVQPGRIANLLLLRSNPAETVTAYDQIEKVILRGRVLDRAELAANQ